MFKVSPKSLTTPEVHNLVVVSIVVEKQDTYPIVPTRLPEAFKDLK